MSSAKEESKPGKHSSRPGSSAETGRDHKSNGMKTVRGSTISFHGLHYSVQVKPPGKKCGSMQKEILHDVNGIFKPGMNAILGATGSGKSSLLDVLAGRKDVSGLTGHLLIDGCRQPKNFKCMAGYVVQDDVVMGTLTVRENFMFSANLRLPKNVSTTEKEARVEETLQELGLAECADTKVGTEFVRGVSGGERKRTNIGMELIISPSVLFLDEPTTGLDASTANAVMMLLHGLTRKGRTIVFSIHQPRYTIFKLFDRLMLLSAGYTVYHGPAEDAIQYFSEHGYECEEHNNPPDFFLDVINGDSSAVQRAETMTDKADKATNGTPVILEMRPLETSAETSNLATELHTKYTQSKWCQSVTEELTTILSKYEKTVKDSTEVILAKGEYATSFLTQFGVVSGRTVKNLIRSPQASVLQLVTTTFFALMVGIIYLQVGYDYPYALQNRVGAFFFMTMNMLFANMSSIELFIKERAIFIHENASGFYRVSAYFFAKLLCDLIPMRLLPLIPFCLIAYFMIGLKMEVAAFFFFFLNLFMTTMAAAGLGFFISSSVRVFAIANLLVALCLVVMMIFGGLLVNLEAMADWLSWIQYISIVHYSLTSLSINELYNLTLCATVKVGYNTTYTDCSPQYANNYLTTQGIYYNSAWDLWQNQMALGIMAIGFMFLAYVQLRRLKKLK